MEAKQTTLAAVIFELISDWGLLVRSVVALALLLLMVWIGVVAIWRTIEWLNPPFQVVVKDSGAIILSTKRTAKTGLFLLNASGGIDSPWINTGISIMSGQKLTITASGRICLAAHHMRLAEYTDIPPPHPWVGPEGLRGETVFPPRTLRQEDADRARYQVAPNIEYGRLIGVISDETPNNSLKILNIGKKNSFTSDASGYLWLTVNDIWLSPATINEVAGKSDEWRAGILRNRYWNVWYDDNAGSFLVTVELEP